MSGYLENLDLSINPESLEKYKVERIHVIGKILAAINSSKDADNFALKGGTGLLFCHGLNRFSEDIDLDAIRPVNLIKLIENTLKNEGFTCSIRVAKNTETVTRYMINYGSVSDQPYPLKIEISYREKKMLSRGIFKPIFIKGIRTYSMDHLLNTKFAAFSNREKARDFYDLSWMLDHHPQLFDARLATQLLQIIAYKDPDSLEELLKEEYINDHILTKIDTTSLVINFIEKLEVIASTDNSEKKH
ncbi:nucleotidyl transferase AbiEii/AbiGii toxin family protein [Paenibacillus sp. WLX1005]|uniref:nucleotidyl transferase AbiEii/AbiGii toxin family protein n=1 Tax=unclassified Paenibacillus TaxID=185978 RepID=UPI0039841429